MSNPLNLAPIIDYLYPGHADDGTWMVSQDGVTNGGDPFISYWDVGVLGAQPTEASVLTNEASWLAQYHAGTFTPRYIVTADDSGNLVSSQVQLSPTGGISTSYDLQIYVGKILSIFNTANNDNVDLYNVGGSGASLLQVSRDTRIIGYLNADTGFRVNNAAASNSFLVGDGTNFVATTAANCKVALDVYSPSTINLSAVAVNANTTSAQNLMSYTFASAVLNTIARTFRVRCSGIISTKTGTQPAITFLATLGGVQIITYSVGTPSAQGSNGSWELDFTISTFSTGASGTVMVHGTEIFRIPSGGTFVNVDTNTGSSGAIDLTGAPVLQIQVQFTTQASTSNACTQQFISVERIA